MSLSIDVARSLKVDVGVGPVKLGDGLWGCPCASAGCAFKPTTYKHAAVTHIRVHSGEKPYVCCCGYRCSHLGDLKKHISRRGAGHRRADKPSAVEMR